MLRDIFKGIQAYFDAFALMRQLKLWHYFIIPILISLITAIAIALSAYSFSDNLNDFIYSLLPWEPASWLKGITEIIMALIIIALGLILYKHIIMALSAPFMSPVSEKIEAHLLGSHQTHRNTSFQSQLWRGIKLNLRNLLMELVLTIPILLLKFIPVVNIFSTALLFAVQAYYAGFGVMDYTLERHYNYKESTNFVRRNRGLAIGNGLMFLAFLFIPVIGVILVLPYSVTAASLKTVERINSSQQLAAEV